MAKRKTEKRKVELIEVFSWKEAPENVVAGIDYMLQQMLGAAAPRLFTWGEDSDFLVGLCPPGTTRAAWRKVRRAEEKLEDLMLADLKREG